MDPGVNKSGYHKAMMSGAADLVLDQITLDFAIPINLVAKFFSLEWMSPQNCAQGLYHGVIIWGNMKVRTKRTAAWTVCSTALSYGGSPGICLGLGPGS